MTRIGVFEDEPILQLMWETIAEDAGFAIAGVCTTVDEGCELARVGQMDVALLDVKLAGEYSVEILAMLEQRNIPVLVCTGLDLIDLPESFRAHTVLAKPFNAGRAIRHINELCSRELVA